MYQYKVTIIPNKEDFNIKADVATRLIAISEDLQRLTGEPLKFIVVIDSDGPGVNFNYRTPSYLLHTLINAEISLKFIPASN